MPVPPSRTDAYFYPRPPRGGRPGIAGHIQQGQQISIHALREEGDFSALRWRRIALISIHALREEGDMRFTGQPWRYREFLSTPSARRATDGKAASVLNLNNFYPRPPRGGRPRLAGLLRSPPCKFLSTPSARRATSRLPQSRSSRAISIHALREEGDTALGLQDRLFSYFYPRPPRGGRPAC